jgi:UrcA family protein
MLKQIIIASLAAAAAIGAASSAQAQTPASDIQSVTVSVAGLDMRSDSGARILLQRIETAAGKVCGGEPTLALDRKQQFQPCVRKVTARTVSGLNYPRLAALIDGNLAPSAKLASAR